MIGDCADSRWAADEAWRNTLFGAIVANFVVRAVLITLAAFFEFFTSANVGVTDCAGRAVAFVTTLGVYAECIARTRVSQFDTLVDVSTGEIWIVSESTRTHAEAILWADINAIFVFLTGICGSAVTRFRDTEVATSFQIWGTAAGVIVETD